MVEFKPNGDILLVYGDEIFQNISDRVVDGELRYDHGEYRDKLREYLYARDEASGCPVRKGTHDFWVTYYSMPRTDGNARKRQPNWSFQDTSITPRQMRGIIEMENVPASVLPADIDTLRNHISTLMQEYGHHWIVPRDLSIQNSAFWPPPPIRPYLLPGYEETSLSLEENTPFYGVPLMGRDNSHWSAFFEADLSAFDGINWENVGVEDGYQIWRRKDVATVVLPKVTPDGMSTELELSCSYNDLDLLLMGVKNRREAYQASQNQFRWLQTRLTAPLTYLAGLFIAFSQKDFLYFGFYHDHRQVACWFSGSSDKPKSSEIFPLPGYRPLADKFNGVVLRIVRRGANYFLQARLSDAQDGVSLLAGIEPLTVSPPGSSLDVFQTLTRVSHTTEPKAMGLMLKSSSNADVCEAAFRHIEILDGTSASGSELTITTDKMPPNWEYSSTDGYNTLPPYGSLVSNRPVKKARIRIGRGWIDKQWLYLTTPYLTLNEGGGFEITQRYDHSASVDEAPKILTRVPPSHDFAVATVARIDHSSFCPWAGAVGTDMQMWGKESSASTGDVFISDTSVKKQLVPDLPEGKYIYKVAFIIVARKEADIQDSDVANVDVVRRYWDAAFDLVTLGRRHSNSKLT